MRSMHGLVEVDVGKDFGFQETPGADVRLGQRSTRAI
jgi:hypothetical protein